MQLVKLTLLLVVAQALEDAPAPDQECPGDFSYFQGMCYYHSGGLAVPWVEVPLECYNFHPAAQPVSIHNRRTNDFLTTLAGTNTGSWLGLFRDQAYPDSWFWLDGSDVDYTSWLAGEPENSYDCATLSTHSAYLGHWTSHYCTTSEWPYYCQVNSSSVANN